MTSHMTCMPVAPMPHQHPPPLPVARDHGITSELNQDSMFHRPVPLSAQGFLGCDEPSLYEPSPHHSRPELTTFDELHPPREFPDPELCVTPEKGQLSRRQLGARLPRAPGTRVRFTGTSPQPLVEEEAEEGASSLDSSAGSGSCSTGSGRLQQPVVIKHVKKKTPANTDGGLQTGEGLQEELIDRAKSLGTQVSALMSRMETVSIDSETLEYMGYSMRPHRPSSHHGKTSGGEGEEAGAREEQENVLARPEFNTTLRIRAEIERLKAQQFDPSSLDLPPTLAKPSKKVYKSVDVRHYPLESLPPVDVTSGDVISKKKKRKGKVADKESTSVAPPDPLRFLTPDLISRPADLALAPPLSLTGQQSRLAGHLATLRPPPSGHAALGLYERCRNWAGRSGNDWDSDF